MSNERRRFERKQTAIRVEMSHPAIGMMIGSTQDISDGGASVVVDNRTIPPIGTVLNVTFKKVAGAVNLEPVSMKIVYIHKQVVGLMFCSDS